MNDDDNEPRDLWDNERAWNTKPVAKFEPLTVESFKKIKKSEPVKTQTMADKYREAWIRVYLKLPPWRQKEVDNYTKGDNLPLKGHEKDFAQQVASIAEQS